MSWKLPFKLLASRHHCPNEFYSCPGPNRFSICGTSSTGLLVIPSPYSPSCTLSWCWGWVIGRLGETLMKRSICLLITIGLLALFAGCKKQESDADAIRSGINQHLASLKTINLGAMDMNVTSFSVQGDQAQAQVEFKPKTGAPNGAGMQVAYSLEKQNGLWVVQSTQPAGGSIQHPAPGENPPMNPGSPSSSSMPNFRDLVPGGGNSTALPPGRPPLTGRENLQPQ